MDSRDWYDRHGPLAFYIATLVTALCALAVSLHPESAGVILPIAVPSIAAMAGVREWARQARVKHREQAKVNGQDA